MEWASVDRRTLQTQIMLMNCYLADDIDNDSDLTAEETVTLLCIFVYLLQWNCDRSLCCLHCNRGHECRSQRNKMINISIQLNLFETKNRHRSFSFISSFANISVPFAVFVSTSLIQIAWFLLSISLQFNAKYEPMQQMFIVFILQLLDNTEAAPCTMQNVY